MSAELESLRVSKRELEVKAEGYLGKMKVSREEQTAVEEQLRKELSSQVYICIHCSHYSHTSIWYII